MADAVPFPRDPAFDSLREGQKPGKVTAVEEIRPTPREFPAPMGAEANTGLVGRFVDMVAPHTEADPAGLRMQFLVFFGNAVCPATPDEHGPFVRVGATRHRPVENLLLVGSTSAGRKGTSGNEAKRSFLVIEDPWVSRITTGLSSGEGLIWEVRDKVEGKQPITEGRGRSKRTVGQEDVVLDEGAPDKRLMAIEPEFGKVLTVMARDKSILSAVLREAFDCAPVLRTLTKNSPSKATGASVSVTGHITATELVMLLDSVSQANGFANRFPICAVRRSQFLPDGGNVPPMALAKFSEDLRDALVKARGIGEMARDREASAIWRELYPTLAGEKAGLIGAITSRAEAHVLRFSMIYALMDGSASIGKRHLMAAAAVWDYADRSARWVFGTDGTGNPDADAILRALESAKKKGLSRSDIRDVFNRNRSAAAIDRALDLLSTNKLARGFRVSHENSAKPREIWIHARYDHDLHDFTTLPPEES